MKKSRQETNEPRGRLEMQPKPGDVAQGLIHPNILIVLGNRTWIEKNVGMSMEFISTLVFQEKIINWNLLRSSDFCFTRPWSPWAFLPLPGEKLPGNRVLNGPLWKSTMQASNLLKLPIDFLGAGICWNWLTGIPNDCRILPQARNYPTLLGASRKSRLAPRMHPIPSISILFLGIFLFHASEPGCFPIFWIVRIFTLHFPLPTSILLGSNISTKNTCTQG